jgi:enolase
MVKTMIAISLKDEYVGSINAIKKAFKDQGYSNMFSAFAINSIIRCFEEKDWGEFLTKENKTYTTADIVHDSMQDDLTGEEKWIKM